ncbi:SGNH/GDSL hydrolase family protein [Candidatus Uhrbacteria bacterium]|nr:SGNH/GDSL hydrolase family protein [Candidatus Uhrbacteria bacterium]
MFLFLCFVIIGFIAWDIYQTRRLIAVGTGLSAKAIPYSRSAKSPSILVVGDSTAVGTGASASTTSLAGLLGVFYPESSIENRGVNGSKTKDLLSRGDLKNGQFDLVMIHIGGNDTVRFTNLTELSNDIRTVLGQAKRISKNVVLVSTGNVGTARLLPFGTRWAFAIRTRQVREIFKQAASEHGVTYVDLYREPSNDPFAQNPLKYYAADSFHPSDDGYADWFGLISKQLPLDLKPEAR